MSRFGIESFWIVCPNLQGAIRDGLVDLLADPATLLKIAAPCRADQQRRLLAAAARRQKGWSDLPSADLRSLLLAVLSRVEVHPDRIDLTIDNRGFIGWLVDDPDANDVARIDLDQPMTKLTIAATLKRRGNELRFLIAAPADEASPNAGLARTIAQAHQIGRRLLQERVSIEVLAQQEGLAPSYVTRLVRISFLSPDVIARLISGRHDPELTVRRLLADTRFPLNWAEQRKALNLI